MLAAWLVPLLAAFVLSLALCRLAVWLMPRLRFLDQPGAEAHKQQARAVPYGGGGGMAVAVAVAALAAWWLPLPEPAQERWWPVWTGAGLLALIGLIDDLRPLPARLKLIGQMAVCAGAVLVGDLPVDTLRAWPWLGALASFAWLVLLTNAYNLLDHADGLSGSVALVGCVALAAGAAMGGDVTAARNFLIIALAIGGFLVWNKPPARIYMGDSGSLAIGFLIGCGTLMTTFWPSSESGSPLALLSPLLIAAIPLFDTAAVVVKRLRRGAPIMRGDRNHISHRLTRLGVGARASLGAVVALQTALAAATIQLRSADLIAGIVALAQAAAVCVALVLLETSRDHG
jgi:UDP-GlcNAc:undecaprenyl-phosphate GlcNAc-1-phosphate transferase